MNKFKSLIKQIESKLGLSSELKMEKKQTKSQSPWLPDDVFLVAYPKSGITWMRFLLANIRSEEEIDFHTVDQYIPVVGQTEIIEKLTARPRIFQSHEKYTEDYPKVIFIVRDGRDVYVSYFHYLANRLPKDMTFHEFLLQKDHITHIPANWQEHAFSWLPHMKISENILFVKYEDMLSDTFKELKRVSDFIGLDVSDEKIQSAVALSDFSNMQRLEKERGRSHKPTEGITFVRKGKSGQWREVYDQKDIEQFKLTDGEALIALGYEENMNW